MRTRIIHTALLAFVALVQWHAVAQVDEDAPGYFPFWIPAFDETDSFTDMSFLSPEPAGASGRAQVRNGHFYDAAGKRLRLLGTNLCFQGPFPDKEHAPAIAGHLRKLGFNIIRFHHIDGRPAPRGLWLHDYSAFDPEQLDKLDWLIYQLKEHGIFTNLNLHVSRTYQGIPKDCPRAFRYGKGLDNFYPEYIQSQKGYAKRLLSHRNPYTDSTYAKEPAVLVIELNNENALTNVSWEDLRAMPEPHLTELTRQWQAWLASRYVDTAKLRASWDEASEPLGEELLTNPSFEEGTTAWTPEQHGGAKMVLKLIEEAGIPSGRALEITTQQPGSLSYSLQFRQVHLDIQDGAPYTLAFWARANEPCSVGVAVMLDQAPWRACGLRVSPALDSGWQQFAYTFKCMDPVPEHCRLSFNFNNRVGQFWLADLSLRRGGLVGLPEDQTIEAGNIPIPPPNAGDAECADFWAFLSETECRYVEGMMQYLREDIGVEAFLCDTQASYGGLLGMYREATYGDFVDMHFYWQHPSFPGQPWDSKNWFIPNTSMVESETGGTLARLAWFRCFGKPYTVSEYDHPAPNDHAVELFPMYASFAAAQDWDGIYQFNYRSGELNPDTHRLGGYFELWNHPGKQVFLPIAALMFRMNTVKPRTTTYAMEVPREDLPRHNLESAAHRSALANVYPHTLLDPVGYRLVEDGGPPRVPTFPEASTFPDEAIVWNPSDPDGATYTVNVPAVRAAAGYVGGREMVLGDATIHVTAAAENWAAVAVGALDGRPLAESSRVLVVAAGRIENVNMGWNEKRTTVSNRWGGPPVLAEGIEAAIHLPVGGHVTALDGTGRPKGEVEFERTADGIAFTIGPKYATLWYAVTP